MTKRECAIVMAYTGICMLTGENFSIFHEYIEEKLGRPVHTHELPELEEEIKEKSKDDFLNLCRTATDKNTKEEVLNIINEEMKELQPTYKHIATRKLLQKIKDKIKTLQ